MLIRDEFQVKFNSTQTEPVHPDAQPPHEGDNNNNNTLLQSLTNVTTDKYKNLAIANRSRVSCINTNNNTMTLKSGLEVTQGHWKWYYLKAWLRFPIRLL